MYLKEFREKIGLSQKEMAEKLNIDKTNIGRYERDEVKPTSTALEKYIKVLKANPNFLFLGTEPHVIDVNCIFDDVEDDVKAIIKDLCMLMPKEEIMAELKKIRFDVIQKKFEIKHNNNILIKFLNFTGPSRPVLFLYYILQIIVKKNNENKDEKESNYQELLIQIIKKFPKWNIFINQPMFTNIIIDDFLETVKFKLNEQECQFIIQNAQVLLSRLEEQMPIYVIKAHKFKA